MALKKSEIIECVQARLIADLTAVVAKVREDFGEQLNNAWILDHLGRMIGKLRPAKAGKSEYSRVELEKELTRLSGDKLSLVQEHVPEIREEDVKRMVSVIGSLYESISSRAKAELKYLETHGGF